MIPLGSGSLLRDRSDLQIQGIALLMSAKHLSKISLVNGYLYKSRKYRKFLGYSDYLTKQNLKEPTTLKLELYLMSIPDGTFYLFYLNVAKMVTSGAEFAAQSKK